MSKQINKIYNEKLNYRMKINTLQAEIRELQRKILDLKEKNKELFQENHELTEKYLANVEKCNQLEMDNFTVMNVLFRQRRSLNSYQRMKEKMDQDGIISVDSAAELIKNLEDENVDLLEIIKTKF